METLWSCTQIEICASLTFKISPSLPTTLQSASSTSDGSDWGPFYNIKTSYSSCVLCLVWWTNCSRLELYSLFMYIRVAYTYKAYETTSIKNLEQRNDWKPADCRRALHFANPRFSQDCQVLPEEASSTHDTLVVNFRYYLHRLFKNIEMVIVNARHRKISFVNKFRPVVRCMKNSWFLKRRWSSLVSVVRQIRIRTWPTL